MGRKKKYKNKEESRMAGVIKSRERNRLSRLTVLKFYSSEIPHCACCGEKEIKFLSIDHINGGGSQHRRSMGMKKGKGGNINHWIIKNNFPTGFQVLCHNCNMAKGFYGECPHKSLL